MSLVSGQRFGPYEIVHLVGVGGMGEVYEARDPRLDRHVAIKVLPEAFTKDEERVARFQREARLLAKLNHPAIASIFEAEKQGDTAYLVMELVPGATLAERLSREPLSWEEALPLFRQIAEALEAAHDKGVVHRDLKPANIKITPEGRVKILDFGLAKAFDEDPTAADAVDLSHSPTMTREATRAGAILGTAAFMSPEQAKGKPVDKRVDIWAFGCVLYEALTGRRAFEGETAAEILANVLKSEPDWSRLPGEVPAGVRRLLERCLTKDRSRRLRDIGEAWVILDEPRTEVAARTGTSAPRRWRLIAALVATFLLGGLASWTVLRSGERPSVRVPRRFSIKLSPSQPMPSAAVPFVLSPDGNALVYVANVQGRTRLVRRRFDENVSEEIPGTEDAQYPFFSPDGQWVGFLSSSDYQSSFFRDATLKKVSRQGGPVVTLASVPSAFSAATWGDDGAIVFSSGVYPTEARLTRVSAAGGEPEALGASQTGWITVDDALPGGRALLLESGEALVIQGRISVRSLEGGEEHVLVENGWLARYVPTGHVMYVGSDNVLFALPFDLERLEATGPPVPVLERVGWYSFSREGSLVYRLPPEHELVWVDREGGETPFGPSPWPHRRARISPDGTRLVLDPKTNTDLWLYDLARGALTRLTIAPGVDSFPLWSRDGTKIFYVSRTEDTFDLMSMPSDGSGPPERILRAENETYPYSWANGQLVVEENNADTGADISLVSLEGEPEVRPWIVAPFDQTNPAASPDGRFLAFESNDSGRSEVYVQSLSGKGGRIQVSIGGGAVPLWGPDGREIFYRSANDVMRVPVETASGFAVGEPTRLFSGNYRRDAGRGYELAPDGKRFLMMRPVEEELSTDLVVVLDWFDELERLAPSK